MKKEKVQSLQLDETQLGLNQLKQLKKTSSLFIFPNFLSNQIEGKVKQQLNSLTNHHPYN